MTDTITSDQAMYALAAARPDPELIDQAWDDQRAEAVWQRIPQDTPAPARIGRRWALVAAAATLVAGAGLIAQTAIPSGVPGAPAEANALEKLARIAKPVTIPVGSYGEYTTRLRQVQAGVVFKATTTRWVASDGWVWSVDAGTDPRRQAYQKGPDLVDPHNAGSSLVPKKLPDDPAVLKKQMAERYDELVMGRHLEPAEIPAHRSATLLAAIYYKLADPRTVSDDRAVLFRTLALIDGLTIIDNTTDPDNRPALAASVSYHRPWDDSNQIFTIYFDPANGDPLAREERNRDGSLTQVQVITDRRIVPTLPAHVLKILGTARVKKTVTR